MFLNYKQLPKPLLIFTLILCMSNAPDVFADQLIIDDLIVSSSECIGSGCSTDSASPQNFDFNTLILSNEDVRLTFQDTSSSGSFPTQDWSLIANDSEEGGTDYFGISDGNDPNGLDFQVDSGTNVFHIMEDRVEIGTADATRLLSNVADGVADTDAATVGQLQPLQDELDALLDAGTNQAVIVSELQDRTATLEENVATNATNIEEANNDIDALDTRITAVEQGLSEDDTEISQLESNLGDLGEQVADLSATATSNEVAITNNNTAINTLQAQADSNTTAITTLQTTTSSISSTGDDGSITSANGTGSTAVGSGATAYSYDTAIGYNALITADGSVAVGANTSVDSENSVAIGADSSIATDAVGSVAIGQNAQVSAGATGSVALGQNSIADEANTVSVGSVGNERRITNVADAVNASDAVTLRQLQEVEASVTTQVSNLNDKISGVDDRLDKVGAFASALSALVPNPKDESNTQISLGLGHYSGATAFAAGVFHNPSDKILLNTAVSTAFDSNSTAARAGITFGW